MKREFNDSVIDALIASAVLPNYLSEPTQEEIDFYIAQSLDTSADDDASERVSKRLAAKIAGMGRTRSSLLTSVMASAMNRKSEDDGFCKETIDGLEEARRLRREQILREKEGDNDQ